MNSGLLLRRLTIATSMTICVLSLGCGKAKKPWEVTYPAEGIVKFEGVPLAGAQITLIPVDPEIPDSVRPNGFTQADGSFQLRTYSEGDGAPALKYKVLAMRFPVIGPPDNPSQGPNDLPPKYSRPESSDVILEVTSGEGPLGPIDLRR